MLAKEHVILGLPESKLEDEYRDFLESLDRAKEVCETDDSLEEDHHLLESIDRYLAKVENGIEMGAENRDRE